VVRLEKLRIIDLGLEGGFRRVDFQPADDGSLGFSRVERQKVRPRGTFCRRLAVVVASCVAQEVEALWTLGREIRMTRRQREERLGAQGGGGGGGRRTRSCAEGEEGWRRQRRAIPSAIVVVGEYGADWKAWCSRYCPELEAVRIADEFGASAQPRNLGLLSWSGT